MAKNDDCLFDTLNAGQLADVLQNNKEKVIVIDSRSFLEFNIAHVNRAINMCYSKIMKRRLQQDKLCAKEFLRDTCNVTDVTITIVYDQHTSDVSALEADSFLRVLMLKLSHVFNQVKFLQGGFENFHKNYPFLCEEKTPKCPPVSLSQPCLPVNSNGPTRIFQFLYLGSQYDAMNSEILKTYNITYELNISTNCPKSDFIPDSHFLRIPVNDNSSEKLYPHFPAAFQFIDTVRKVNGCVLIHCLAGISRSPAVAIAYVMKHLRLRSDDAYRYVKSKRATISPNFNFLGQLLEYEHRLRDENVLDAQQSSNFRHRYKKSLHSSCVGMSGISEVETAMDQSQLETNPPLIISNHTTDNLVLGNGLKREHGSMKENISSVFCTKPLRFCLKKSNSAYDLGYFNITVEEPEKKIDSFKSDENLNGVEGIPLSSIHNINSTPCQISYCGTVAKHQVMDWTSHTPSVKPHDNCNNPNFLTAGDGEDQSKSASESTCVLNSENFAAKNYFRLHTEHIKEALRDQLVMCAPGIGIAGVPFLTSQHCFSLDLQPKAEPFVERGQQQQQQEEGTSPAGGVKRDILRKSEKSPEFHKSVNNICSTKKLSAHLSRSTTHYQVDKLYRVNSCPVILSFNRCSSLENFATLRPFTSGNLNETMTEKPKPSTTEWKNGRRNCYSCGNLEHATQIMANLPFDSGRYVDCMNDDDDDDSSGQISLTSANKSSFTSNVGAIRVS